MASLGAEIYRTYDEYGPITVFDDGQKRYLAFGSDDEQSCCLKSNPSLLLNDYTRAMLLVLLFNTPKRVTMLGLGGGSIFTCLHRRFADIELHAVELREAVAQVAYRYFHLPRDNRLTISVADFEDYLNESRPKSIDLLLCDVFTAEGLEVRQLQPEFLEQCSQVLTDGGWLVLNWWSDHKAEKNMLKYVGLLFPEVRLCNTQEGNRIVFAGKRNIADSAAKLESKAKKLAQKLGYSLLPNVKKMMKYRF